MRNERASGGMAYAMDIKSIGLNALEGSNPSLPTILKERKVMGANKGIFGKATRKKIRQEDAAARQEEYDDLTKDQKKARVIASPGKSLKMRKKLGIE